VSLVSCRHTTSGWRVARKSSNWGQADLEGVTFQAASFMPPSLPQPWRNTASNVLRHAAEPRVYGDAALARFIGRTLVRLRCRSRCRVGPIAGCWLAAWQSRLGSRRGRGQHATGSIQNHRFCLFLQRSQAHSTPRDFLQFGLRFGAGLRILSAIGTPRSFSSCRADRRVCHRRWAYNVIGNFSRRSGRVGLSTFDHTAP